VCEPFEASHEVYIYALLSNDGTAGIAY